VAQFYRRAGVEIRRMIPKPDHARFDREEIDRHIAEAKLDGASLAVTEKDFVKLSELGFGEDELFVLRREMTSKEWANQVFERLQSHASFARLKPE